MDEVGKKTIRSGIWYTISDLLAKGSVFFSLPIFARLLSLEEYGEFTNFITWQNIFLIVVSLQLETTIAKANFDFKEKINDYVATLMWAQFIIGCFIYILVCLNIDTIENILMMKSEYVHWMFIYLIFSAAIPNLQSVSQIQFKYKLSSFTSVSTVLISTTIAIIACFFMVDKLWGRIAGQQIILISFNVIVFVFLTMQGHVTFKQWWEFLRYGLLMSLPITLHALAGNLLGAADKIFIKSFCGNSDLAYYGMAHVCGMAASVVWQVLNRATVPWLFHKLDNNEYDEIKITSIYYVDFFFCVMFCVMLGAPELLLLFGGKCYEVAVFVIPPIIMAVCLQFVYSLYVNIEFFHKKTCWIAAGTIAALSINIILNYYFVPVYGYIASAYTTMISYGLLMIFHYLIVKRHNMTIVYKNREIFIRTLVMLLGMFVVNILYEYDTLRISIGTIYTCIIVWVCYKKRKQLRNLIYSLS